MSLSIEEMRKELISNYPGTGWEKKVKAMSGNQVTAIYLRIQKETQKAFTDIFYGLRDTVMAQNDVTAREVTVLQPYEDQKIGDYKIISKEVLLEGWNKAVGKCFDFAGIERKVKSVEVIDDQIKIIFSRPVYIKPETNLQGLRANMIVFDEACQMDVKPYVEKSPLDQRVTVNIVNSKPLIKPLMEK